MLITIIVLDY